MNTFIDILYILSGAYLIYAAILMKVKKQIIGSVVLSKGIEEKSIRDKDGFIAYLYGKLIFFGAVIILAGIVNLYNDYLAGPGYITLAVSIIFAAAVVGYGIVSHKAIKMFIDKK